MMFGLDDPRPRRPRKQLTKDQRFEVWKKYIGATKAEGPCYVCKKTIHQQDFDVGHNIARASGGTDNISNYRPICRQCNRGMGTTSIEAYKRKLNGPAATNKKKAAATTKKKPATKAKPKATRKRPRDPIEAFFSGF